MPGSFTAQLSIVIWPDIDKHRRIDAVSLAEDTIQLAPLDAINWLILGSARCAAGESQGAIEVLQKSMDLGHGGSSYEWFILAMAHQQLGNHDDAQRWHDQAVNWMDKHAPTSEELIRLRAACEERLGPTMDDRHTNEGTTD